MGRWELPKNLNKASYHDKEMPFVCLLSSRLLFAVLKMAVNNTAKHIHSFKFSQQGSSQCSFLLLKISLEINLKQDRKRQIKLPASWKWQLNQKKSWINLVRNRWHNLTALRQQTAGENYAVESGKYIYSRDILFYLILQLHYIS